jgi:glycosyltransferase involved in cell wall biosynthesis
VNRVKVIIQIPCFNEAQTLPATVRELPRSFPGVETVELLVIDDGSTDGTADVARALGVDHVVGLGSNRGLARAFSRGIEYALELGADIVVNTDGDNQYCAEDMHKLLSPILENKADLVVGSRPIREHPEFSPFKKLLQRIGSLTLRWISRTDVRDAASGFRAYSREACLRNFIHSSFSYCMESLIQAGNIGLRVASVDVRVNPKTRESRLFSSIPQYLYRSAGTMMSMFVLYRPGRFFSIIGAVFLSAALVIGVRFIYLLYFTPRPPGTHIPSLIALTVCAVTGFLMIMLGILGELVKFQRRIAEEHLYLQRKRNVS